ncbi:MAG: hypothetical protein LBG90_01785 [Spirochaetaceae bacterium]|jgi:DNA repair protein RadC|nr:hypothetical protein [Spirochaetaceae bacterium]
MKDITYDQTDKTKKLPREKLGVPETLSDSELLEVLLEVPADSARHILKRLDPAKEIPSVKDLAPDLNETKAQVFQAILEFGRRRWGPVKTRIRHPQDIYHLVRHYAQRRQEQFLCISLNGAHEVLAVRVVTIGLVNRTIVHPREVFADPLADRAFAVAVAHNHPSGQLEPSPEDDEITFRLREAADLLGLPLLDHVIFSGQSFFSYRQKGKLKPPGCEASPVPR